MAILPLFYLFLFKKKWRLLLGVIIAVITLFGYLAPEAITHSLITNEIEKNQPSLQQLEINVNNITDTEINPSDSQKILLEKTIAKQKKKIEEAWKKVVERDGDKDKNFSDYQKKLAEQKFLVGEWSEKWGERKNYQTLLFCGEEFNQELISEKIVGSNIKKKQVKDLNIIDFEQADNNKIAVIQKKLEEICQQLTWGEYPIVWLKNIDKVTNPEVKDKLLAIIDPKKNSNLGKFEQEIELQEGTGVFGKLEQDIDLSRFSLVATTLTKSPKLSPEIEKKLKKIETFWDKYFWWIFCFSLGLELIVFYTIIKINKKDKKSQSLLIAKKRY